MPAVELLLRALSQRDHLVETERAALLSLPRSERAFEKGQSIIAMDSRPEGASLLLSGIAGREVSLEDGRRQITALHVPGDFLDLDGLLLKRLDHGAIALTDCRTVYVPHAGLHRLVEDRARLTQLFWLMAAVDASIQRQWVVSLGRRDALEHLAHLLCELYMRLKAVGLADRFTMQLPLSQMVLADVLGLSPVHVNRTIKALRACRLVSWHKTEVVIQEFERLAKLAGFDPSYLHLAR